MPIATRGDLCMKGSAPITGASNDARGRRQRDDDGHDDLGAARPERGDRVDELVERLHEQQRLRDRDPRGAARRARTSTSTGFGVQPPDRLDRRRDRGRRSSGRRATRARSRTTTSSSSRPARPPGSDKASTTDWTTSDSTRTYGASNDLWGTTWTEAQVEASNFGIRLKVRNLTTSSRTASVDHVQIRVYYQPPPSTTIGTSGTPLASVQIAGTCQYFSPGRALALHVDRQGVGEHDRVGAAEPQQAGRRPRLLVREREARARCTTARPAASRAASTRTPRCDNSVPGSAEVTPEQLELHLPGARRAREPRRRALLEPRHPRAQDQGHDLHRRRLPLRRRRRRRPTTRAAGSSTRPDDLEFDELVCAGGSGHDAPASTTGMDELGPDPEHDDRARGRRLRVRPGLHAGAGGPVGASRASSTRTATAPSTRTSTRAGRSSATASSSRPPRTAGRRTTTGRRSGRSSRGRCTRTPPRPATSSSSPGSSPADCAPPGDTRLLLPRDHAALELTLALAKAAGLGRARLRPPA